mmetsp:Transcript_40365/g.106946  ORF Transcript_40365/g.106946 Transcript_40365/m.106946 type:complete len:201 (-) Transcript_40365:476-1078(-)
MGHHLLRWCGHRHGRQARHSTRLHHCVTWLGHRIRRPQTILVQSWLMGLRRVPSGPHHLGVCVGDRFNCRWQTLPWGHCHRRIHVILIMRCTHRCRRHLRSGGHSGASGRAGRGRPRQSERRHVRRQIGCVEWRLFFYHRLRYQGLLGYARRARLWKGRKRCLRTRPRRWQRRGQLLEWRRQPWRWRRPRRRLLRRWERW